MTAHRILSQAEEKKIAGRYAKGASSTEIAQAYGIHRSTVVEIVRRVGGAVRPAGGPRPMVTSRADKVVRKPVKKAAKKATKAA